MSAKKTNNKNSKSKLPTVVAGLILLAVISAGAILFLNHRGSEAAVNVPYSGSKAKTTSTLPTAQPDYSGGTDKGTSVPASSSTTANVKDNNGAISNTPPSSTWTKSSDGAITVYSPAADQLVNSEIDISGASTADSLGFRIIDDVSGVISQGTLNVNNGKFSGTLTFSTPAKQGRIDLFQQNSTGMESSNVSIPVKFK